jgi:Holliday junction resolvasome RuvABC endonuclease subunit
VIVLGIDPGPMKFGWCLARRLANSMGRVEFLRGGYGPSPGEGGFVGASSAVFELLEQSRSVDAFEDAVAIEVPTELHPGGIDRAAMVARSKQLLATAKVAERLASMARLRGLGVAEMRATDWRRAFCGRGNPSNAEIAAACAVNVVGMPKRSNAHVRDALGLACVVLWNPSLARKGAA